MPHLDEGLLTALLDNELDQVDRQAAENHMAGCEECRRLYEEVRALATQADGLVAEIELPPKGNPAPKTAPSGPHGGRLERWRALAWAASLVLAVGLGWAASDLRYSATRSTRPAEALNLADSAARAGYRADQVVTPSAPAAAPAPAPPVARTTTAAPQAKLDKEANAPTVSPGAADGEAAAPAKPAEIGALADANRDRGRTRENELRVDQTGAAGAAPRAPSLQAADLKDLTRAESDLRGAPTSGLRQIGMEEAVRTLGGSIRLVDGLQPERILVGPGSAANGADPALDVVRVVYRDPPRRELWLDQQRPSGPEQAARRAADLLAGDTLFSSAPAGANRIRWLDGYGFRLALTGFLPIDSLRALLERVR